MSIRAVSRLLGIHKNTILRLLLTIGGNCRRLLGERLHNLHPKHVQADELWAYVQKKRRRVKESDPQSVGDTYLWIALNSDTKVVLAYFVGKRDDRGANALIGQLRSRTTDPFQLTTDALAAYLPLVPPAEGHQRQTHARHWRSRDDTDFHVTR